MTSQRSAKYFHQSNTTKMCEHKILSRRNFLGAVSILGAGALISGRAFPAWAAAEPGRIDIHHHFQPDIYYDFQRTHGKGFDTNQWTLAKDLEDMDKAGTAIAYLSLTTPGFTFGEVNEVRKVSRGCNDAAAKLVADHPARFGSFATIPLADTEGALLETEYALDTLKADGICLFTNYGDVWLGHSTFARVYEELNRRKTMIYVHPVLPNCCANLSVAKDGVPNEIAMIEFGTDTTRAIASLIFSGMTVKFPNITWIFAHGGGTMPFLIERFFQGGASAEIVPGILTKGQAEPPVKNSPSGEEILRELRKMYYDTAQISNPVALGALRKVIPISQILYGTDYWYRTAVESVRGLTTSNVFSAEELRAINRTNAERILPHSRKS
jgi:predicted TIM-barrel fold metal-dependent hydrolase